MALSEGQLLLIEQRVSNESPSLGVAYFLWLFLGIFGAHRFYAGRKGTALLQILTVLMLVGLIWVLIDAALIPGMIREKREAVRQRIMVDVIANSAGAIPRSEQ